MTRLQRQVAIAAFAVLEVVYLWIGYLVGLGPVAIGARFIDDMWTVGIVLLLVEVVGQAQNAPERRS